MQYNRTGINTHRNEVRPDKPVTIPAWIMWLIVFLIGAFTYWGLTK